MVPTQAQSIDEYIASFPTNVQQLLQNIRYSINKAAPDAQEAIKYNMPCYVLNGNLIYFAAFKKHIGFYATPTAHEAFATELLAYKRGKGSVQFPFSKSLPLDLISRMVAFRVKQNMELAKLLKKV